MSNECICMDMGEATTDCSPVEVLPDVWTQVARHGPGEAKGPVAVTNRSIIYRLHPAEGEPFLAVLNGLWVDGAKGEPFGGLRSLEESTGAKVRFILAPGGAHHLSLTHYADAFPEARVCVAQGRIPRVNTELMAKDNVEAYTDAPRELEEAGLHVHVIQGLMEGPLTKHIARVTEFDFGYVPDSTEPLVVLHRPSGTVTSGGHQWWFVPADEQGVFEVPGLMRFIMKWVIGIGFDYVRPGHIALENNGGFAVHDRDALQQSCREILSWEFDALLDLHAQPNKSPMTDAKALFEEALAPILAGEWATLPWPQSSLPADS